jgi:hypothetical protein
MKMGALYLFVGPLHVLEVVEAVPHLTLSIVADGARIYKDDVGLAMATHTTHTTRRTTHTTQ